MTVLVFFFADLSVPAAACLAVGATATASIPALLLADAHRSDFDPRPAVRRVVESEALYVVLHEWDIACRSFSDACRDLAALLILLTTSPKGAMSA